MFDVYFWSVAVFFGILAAIIYKDRKNMEFHHYVLAMRKTKRGIKFIDRIVGMCPNLWKVASTIGMIVAFGVMIYGVYMILLSTQMVIDGTITSPAIQLVLPIPQAEPVSGSGFIGVPFWFWILVVPFVLFPHELSHGIVSRAEKIKVKAVGVMQLLIFSGAFVEPDDKQINKSGIMTKLRIFGAGSVANITIAIIFMLLSQFVLWPFFMPGGLVITDVVADSGASIGGLEKGMVIDSIMDSDVSVDYTTFSSAYAYLLFNGQDTELLDNLTSSVTVINILSRAEPGQTIEVMADGNVYDITLTGRPDNSTIAYMGVSASNVTNSDFMFTFMFPLLWWLTTMSLFIAIFNLLPIYPLDGGLMMESVAEKVSKKHYKTIVKIVTALMVGILVFNFVGPVIIGLV